MFKEKIAGKTVAIAMIAIFASGLAESAIAESKFAEQHPRRHQVNKRLNNQNKRIHQEVKGGDMSKGQAAKLHKEDHQIRTEERSMASQNGGHITKQEQQTLNQQENAVSKQIGK
jgi:hypothetical protein